MGCPIRAREAAGAARDGAARPGVRTGVRSRAPVGRTVAPVGRAVLGFLSGREAERAHSSRPTPDRRRTAQCCHSYPTGYAAPTTAAVPPTDPPGAAAAPPPGRGTMDHVRPRREVRGHGRPFGGGVDAAAPDPRLIVMPAIRPEGVPEGVPEGHGRCRAGPSGAMPRRFGQNGVSLCRAPVAQWTEHLTSDQMVGGSNPSGRANPCLVCLGIVHPARAAAGPVGWARSGDGATIVRSV